MQSKQMTPYGEVEMVFLHRSILDMKKKIAEQQREEEFQRKLELIRKGKYEG